MNTLNRRNVLTAGAAGILGLVGVGRADAAAFTGTEIERLIETATTPAEFDRIAGLARLGKRAAENRAAFFERAAARYEKGVPGLGDGQCWNVKNCLEHVAGHHRDVAQALDHLAETFAGLAEPYTG